MIEINVMEMVRNMLVAAEGVCREKYPEIKEYFESEFRKIGETIIFIQREVAAGRMTEERAILHMEMQKSATRMILLAIEGLGIIALEAAINAALSVVRDTVNAAIGILLL